MISHADSMKIKDQLLALLSEDAVNTERLLERLDGLTGETGISAHAALLLLLTQLSFDEAEARSHWESILEHRHTMSLALQREVGVRIALFDYFININRRVARPCLVDLELSDSGRHGDPSDPVTGLAGDRAFRSALQAELRRAKRYTQQAAVALFDLDDFAAVNERVGRLVGDRILREAAMLLHNKIRDIDVAARPGEDELALLLPETDRNGGLLVAERFRNELETHFLRREAGGRAVELTVSGGVASYPSDAHSPEELLACAAQALYRAKASRKNTVAVYEVERRRYIRCDLDAQGVEVEVLGSASEPLGRASDLSEEGILFESPEPLLVGEEIELRLVLGDAGRGGARLRGRVVRLEQLKTDSAAGSEVPARFEIGVAFGASGAGARQSVLEFLERLRARDVQT